MTEQPKFNVGDSVRVWIVNEYVEATIVRWFNWTHPSGNTYVAYEFATDFGPVCGGHNSIMEVVDPDWFEVET